MKEKNVKRIKIKAGDLMPWFLQDHDTLPQWYLDDTKKFFDGLRRARKKQVDKQSSSAYIGIYKKELC